ncbi:MAG TPA: peptidylprolyl isomerase [Pyrinomonadaceae bacterium]|nr:peptidylprolyl isomerase [Pyrinomonadaceae bacterium]
MSPRIQATFTPRGSALRGLALVSLLLAATVAIWAQPRTRVLQNPTSGDPVSKILLLRIIRAEDERRWDDDLRGLFSARNANVRKRAALAAGRIGNDAAVSDLVALLEKDDETEVRAMAAFALGEIESALGADALLKALDNRTNPLVRGSAIEALGKIAAALPNEQEARSKELGAAILAALTFEARRRSASDEPTILLGLTAVLRSKPEAAGPVVADFLRYSNPRIRGDAANTLARLKLKDGNDQLRQLLVRDLDPVVRANAARVLGATEDRDSFDVLLSSALKDRDARVRVSAIRSLALLKDARATEPLLKRAENISGEKAPHVQGNVTNEALELATTLGRINQLKNTHEVLEWLEEFSESLGYSAPEVEIARARVSPGEYINTWSTSKKAIELMLTNWRAGSSVAQGLGAIAESKEAGEERNLFTTKAQGVLRAMLDYRNSGLNINTLVAVHSEYAVSDVLRALAALKPKDLDDLARKQLKESDIIVRGTAADLLGELPPNESNRKALIAALPVALADQQLNDAALSILDALAKQKHASANEAIKTALGSSDYLVRRRAVALLKTNGVGDFSERIGTVQTRNTAADYERAISRIGRRTTAVVTTTSGAFTIEFLPEEAPLNVDNFVQLAKRGYFNGIKIHRVVPNFVIQDGDPRGDGNGGPGYQIRCEINEARYSRGAVGMALSGKDTGGSQWFVTHSPQPHLDGGYTIFANVTRGMNTVDNIARGDVIRSISISEGSARASSKRNQ